MLLALNLTFIAAAAAWPSVDGALPRVGGGEKDVAVIIGIDKPFALPPIPGAADTARAWTSWLVSTRGMPADRAHLLVNQGATKEEMRDAIASATKQVDATGTLWLVFIGHGAPSAVSKDGLLLGVDAQPTEKSIEARGLSRSEVMKLVAQGKQKQAVVVLDACFSGTTPDGKAPLVPGMQATIPVKNLKTSPKIALLAASARVAGPLPGHDRPAFSYLLLGALRGWADVDKDKKVTVGEAFDFAHTKLTTLVKDRDATPTLGGGRDILLASKANEAAPDLAQVALGIDAPKTQSNSPASMTANATVDELLRACFAGQLAQPCWDAGVAASNAKRNGEAERALRRSCELGNFKVCEASANSYIDDKTYALAVPYLEVLCRNQGGRPCSRLGAILAQGMGGVPRDPPRSFRLFLEACEGGDGSACAMVAVAYDDAVGVEEDSTKVVPYLQKGCDLDNAGSCSSLADVLFKLDEPQRARKARDKACRLDRRECK